MQEFLERHGSTPLKTAATLAELVRRPELSYEALAELDPNRPELPEDVIEQININIKYDGYIRRQLQQVAQFKKMESRKLDENFDYSTVGSLRREACLLYTSLGSVSPSAKRLETAWSAIT